MNTPTQTQIEKTNLVTPINENSNLMNRSHLIDRFKPRSISQEKCPSIYKKDNERAISQRTSSNLKRLKNNPELIKFYIRQQIGTDVPVNTKIENFQQGYVDGHYKVEKYLQGGVDSDADISNLCYLYDNHLTEIPGKFREIKTEREKTRLANSDMRKGIYDILNIREKKG